MSFTEITLNRKDFNGDDSKVKINTDLISWYKNINTEDENGDTVESTVIVMADGSKFTIDGTKSF